ncbi:lipase [Candidatus Entotheonella serta]|nr:lipase [Candidatus Entotheonella serta]
MSKRDVRICFVGDSFVNGTGDLAFLGWTGRLCAASLHDGIELKHYNLGIRRDSSADIARRWHQEVQARFPDYSDNRIVFSFGVNDTTMVDGQPRVSMADSITHARSMLTRAAEQYPVLMIGLLPIDDDAQNERSKAVDAAYASLCAELKVSFLSVFDTMDQQQTWRRDAAANDGTHPFAKGYEELAELVLAWESWWFTG